MIGQIASEHEVIVTLEDNVHQGGFGQQVADWLYTRQQGVNIINISIPDQFIEHGSVNQLYAKLGMDAGSVVKKIADAMDLKKNREQEEIEK